ncbi:hypothetical protein ANCDUO_27364 [Ancylostoma duodenale]|uniref:Uncharacterized protein n=1 Tax=Ancylostoma duodenale TaxID=51022 RepID=A0A0C2F6M4_9BILA|nr:hypothetical protein ANCDUO_27364 [Ancylostoma duodenale]
MEDFSITPTTVKLPPTLSPQSHLSHESTNSIPSFSVALPATITRREVRGLLKDEFRGYPRTDARTAAARNPPSRTLKAALANIQRSRSIFHSAEQLAGTSS